MLREFKFSNRNSGKSSSLEEIENTPINTNKIEDKGVGLQGTKFCKTPTKPRKSRCSNTLKPFKTPDKQGVSASNPFGVSQKNVLSSNISELGVDSSKYYKKGNGGFANVSTPIASRVTEGGSSGNLECNTTKCTPTRSIIKPPNQRLCLTGGGTRAASASGGARMAHFEALCKGIPVSSSSSTVVNTIEVPHFAMKEDPSFWMDHNVQVLIRIRPLNSMEKSISGYTRCLKQDSEQCITWIGQPETRFTFDHIACETLDQETLFKTVGLPMVENCLRGYNSCIFAYGQTGSGKTYTMLGNINNLGDKPSPDCGMTSRIFEYLFTRIRAEEETRDGRLSYSCKCSFLEIYNEQITDLLDTSSTNLLLREDIKTGVYVENLSESEVHTVGDILKLLSQGSSNRKVAATNMNRESSRSHSVFTCIIESRWEKHSTTNIRFARLNLVDLAGSERQKTSGAEGERLKETANINKSLSTLGYVIMVLVDAAHAKTKHVPYRDSRLTFLLQDSLGGNSKTMIIANVSPSICCAAETLNTLKFAQRAKLIPNNAVVNEEPPENVTALQYQIHLLKEEVLLLKPKKVSRSLTFHTTFVEDTRLEHNTPCKMKVPAMGYQKPGVSLKMASDVESSSLKEQLYDTVQPGNGDMHEALIKRTDEVVDLQLESDILKIMLREERSFRIELENRARCLTRDLELAEGKVLQLTRRYEDMREELREAKSISEVLKSQHLVSLREMEDLRNSSNHYVNLLQKREHEISLLKEKASDKKLSYPLSDEVSKTEESTLQINPNKICDSLGKVKRSNMSQSGLASHASNENEMDEVHRQEEAETAVMIVCLQEQLVVLRHQVQRSNLQETETKARLMLLQIELKELQENFELVTQNNKSLVEKLDEKDKQLKALSEEWKSVTTEIEVVLAGGQEAIKDAYNHVGAICLLPQKRKWISEELSRMTRSISEKEVMIKKLTNYLEDATTRKSDMESMIRSLRGAALVITEAQQQDCSEKEKMIMNLTSQLSEKTLTIAELENKMKHEDEHLRNASKCATVAFVVVSRLSDINLNYLNALKHKDIQLMESIGVNMQKDILPYNEVVENVEEEKQTRSLRSDIEAAPLQLSELKKYISYLGQKLNEAKEIKVPKAKKILLDLSKLQSWLKDSGDVLGLFEEKYLFDLSTKEFEFLVLTSELEQMAVLKSRLQKEQIGLANAFEKLKEDVVFQSVDAELKKWILLDNEVKITHLENEVDSAKTELAKRNLIISEMRKEIKVFQQDLKLLKDVTCSNSALQKELQEVTEAKMRLSSEAIELEFELEKSLKDMQVSPIGKGKRLLEALQRIQILEREIAAKDKELCRHKAHISELYLHSGGEACQYEQKFKADQPEGTASHVTNSSVIKSHKNYSRMMDSDTPSKCVGSELVNMGSERKDEHPANFATNAIFLLSSRLATAKDIAHDVSKDISHDVSHDLLELKSRLATAKDIAHDVSHDLLELKSTISGYVSTLDEHQVIK